jgi:anaerobic selenocysteine-containing dehydrogenase
MAMIRIAHEENLIDRPFVERWTRGLDRLIPACCTPEEAGRISGVRAEELRKTVRALGRSSAPFLRVGWGLERNRNGTDAVRAALSLRAVLGRFDRRGSGVVISTSGGYKMDRSPAQAPHLRRNRARTINMSRLGQALDETTDPPLRALYVYNCNPVATAPNQARVVRALGRESLFVAVHEQIWTDTCAMADIVLPATTFLEHTEMCRSYSGYALQWSDPVVDAPGEARPNHRVFSEIARAMGFNEPELQVDEAAIASSIVQDVGGLRKSRYRALPKPLPFIDAFPSRGYADLAAPPGPPVYRPPSVDADLPLILITPASEKAITSQLFEFAPEGSATVAIAPSEAAKRSLKNGDRVRVRNSFGEVVATLAVSDELAAGVASMPKGLWRRSTHNRWTANALAPDHVDAQGGGACYNDARVEILREDS